MVNGPNIRKALEQGEIAVINIGGLLDGQFHLIITAFDTCQQRFDAVH